MKSYLKQLLVGAVLVCSTTVVMAQAKGFYHGFGAQTMIGFYNLQYTSPSGNYSGTRLTGVPGVVYKATYAFNEHLAVSAFPFAGLNGVLGGNFGVRGTIGFELPVHAQFFIGDLDESCFYMGGGFSYAWMATTNEIYGPIIGPQLGLGGQFPIRGNPVGVRVAWSKGINKTNLDVPFAEIQRDTKYLVTLGIYYPIGM
jgi:hypothetical protein